MQNEDYLIRQSDIIPSKVLETPITVIGAGAIGSFAVLALAKMGFHNIKVFDFDEVSDANMSCQWYRISDIKKPKVEALQDLIRDFTGLAIEIVNDRFDGSQELQGLVISSVDSMEVRKLIWDTAKRSPKVQYVIDPRMASEYALSFVMKPHDTKDINSYEKTLYTDQNAVEERCTAKATMYTATMIAGYVAKHVKDILTGTPYARVTHWNIGLNTLQNWMRP
jgi:molybdopterin/thiamine biosynthesis adenylyltransferase